MQKSICKKETILYVYSSIVNSKNLRTLLIEISISRMHFYKYNIQLKHLYYHALLKNQIYESECQKT